MGRRTALAVVVGCTLGAVLAPPLGAASGGARSGRVAPAYVAIGASESVGYQPLPGRRHGVRTDHGYANDLAALERSHWPRLHLVDFGCPGITAVEALRGGGPCHYPGGSEVAAVTRFVRSHRTVLATVDLGFNDLLPCLTRRSVRAACVDAVTARVGRVVETVLRRLEAAGPRLRIVGVLHNDPYLGDYLAGRRGRAFALASIGAIGDLNRTLAAAYHRAGVRSADVPAAFATGDHRLVDFHGRDLPTDVARMCRMSWMCGPAPGRGNIHPNARGYRAIAMALAGAVGAGGGG